LSFSPGGNVLVHHRRAAILISLRLRIVHAES
jgi:hypothetical protein